MELLWIYYYFSFVCPHPLSFLMSTICQQRPHSPLRNGPVSCDRCGDANLRACGTYCLLCVRCTSVMTGTLYLCWRLLLYNVWRLLRLWSGGLIQRSDFFSHCCNEMFFINNKNFEKTEKFYILNIFAFINYLLPLNR